MGSKNYLSDARSVVERDKIYSIKCEPKPEHVFFKWRGKFYKGSIQRMFSEMPDIGIITKSTHPYEKELVDTIRAIDRENERPDIEVSDAIELKNVPMAVSIKENKLGPLTDKEIEYIQKQKPIIGLLNISLDGI